jgi:pyridoxamine 5'-phosphate oxidase
MDLKDLRQNYDLDKLKKKDLNIDPIHQFKLWMKDAVDGQCLEPNAMIFCTMSKDQVPTSRVLLLKEVEDGGFVFYTNYDSSKAKDIENNNKVSIVFNWLTIHRQVRIEGIASKVPKEQSEAYFQSRPRESQIGAYTSPQSTVIENRKFLKKRQELIEEKYKNVDKLPLPDNWGGYRVDPFMMEFWQGRESRLHDRFRFQKTDGGWDIDRLAP